MDRLKKGQPVTVTYHNLTGATYNGKPIDHVVYKYELESSSDGTDEVMAQIMHDPTETIWVEAIPPPLIIIYELR